MATRGKRSTLAVEKYILILFVTRWELFSFLAFSCFMQEK